MKLISTSIHNPVLSTCDRADNKVLDSHWCIFYYNILFMSQDVNMLLIGVGYVCGSRIKNGSVDRVAAC